MSRKLSDSTGSHSVTVIGCGLIGSHFAQYLGRIPGIGRVSFIDPDHYEQSNLGSQNILPGDVGKAKARVLARRLRAQSGVRCDAYVARVQELPLAWLRSTAIVSCLDSRESRRYVNTAAWRLGIPWIDAAVDGAGMLARVNVYAPGAGVPCLECGWGEQHYAALEQVYPCNGGAPVSRPTNSPAALGGLAASLQAIELEKLLRDERQFAALGREVFLDVRHHKHLVTTLRHNPACRFDHATWQVSVLPWTPAQLTLGEALRIGGGARGSSLSLEEHRFARGGVCPNGCGPVSFAWCLDHRIPRSARTCPQCHQGLVATGADLRDRLGEAELEDGDEERSMASFGFRPGDIFRIQNSAECETFWEFPMEATRPRRTVAEARAQGARRMTSTGGVQ